MEVACSLDEFAQALSGDGYINEDSSYFHDAHDLPSMLRALESKTGLDSPESFPESPCSDEDIARVLEITQMSSPSLLESCIPDSFAALTPSQSHGGLDVNKGSVTKTKDPCITNAVLHGIFSNTSTAGLQGRPSLSLDAFCLQSNIFSNSVSVSLNHVADAKENDVIHNPYFDSTPVLSPLSENDQSLQHLACSYSEQVNQTANLCVGDSVSSNKVNELQEEAVPENVCIKCTQDDNKSSEVETDNTTQKRKRKRKSYSRPSKSKKGKNKKNGNPSQKQQPKSKKAKLSDEKLTNTTTSQETPRKPPSISKERPTSTDNDKNIRSNNETAPNQKEGVSLRRSSRSTKSTENYNFRLSSLVKRVETEQRQSEPKQPKGKAKPPPLSKYRRRTANARERDRMKDINDAFDVLKQSLPTVDEESKQKMTKFTVLKFALNYISALRDMLGYPDLDSPVERKNMILAPSSVSSSSLSTENPLETDIITSSLESPNPKIIHFPVNVEDDFSLDSSSSRDMDVSS